MNNTIGRREFCMGAASATAEGHARTLAVNVLAPYILTAQIKRPRRLIYLSSGMHRSGSSSLDDVDWLKRTWYWHHHQVQTPAAQVTDSGFQERLIGTLARLSG